MGGDDGGAMALRDWKARHLLGIWSAYWVALLVAAALPAARVVVPLLQDPRSHGSVSMRYAEGSLAFTATRSATEVWIGSVSLVAAALWIALPPLALWLAWLVRRPRGARPPLPHAPPPHPHEPRAAEHAPVPRAAVPVEVPLVEEGHAPPTDARR